MDIFALVNMNAIQKIVFLFALSWSLSTAHAQTNEELLTARDSVFVLSGDIVFSLSKTLKQSGIDVYGNIYGPFETHRVFSMYHASSGELIHTNTAPYNPHLACMDSLEVSDFNFDGYPDLRDCNPPNYEHLYLIYEPEKDTFLYNNLLSTLNDVKINDKEKLITGTNSISTTKYSNMNVKIGSIVTAKEFYQLSGACLKSIARVTVQYDETGKSTTVDTAYFTFQNQRLIPIDKATFTSLSTLKPVPIETVVAEIDSMEIIDGHFLFKVKLSKSTVYSYDGVGYTYLPPMRTLEIWDLDVRRRIFKAELGYTSNNANMDSIEINDFNFDNQPDFRYAIGNSDYLYMVYHADQNTFIIEPYLNKLENIRFDWHDAVVEGEISYYQTDFKNKSSHPNKQLSYREYYRFCGTDLKNVEKKTDYYTKRQKILSSKTEYFIYENRSLYPTDVDLCYDLPEGSEQPVSKLTYPILISKENDDIRAELTQILTDQYLWTDSSKQTQKLMIWSSEQAEPIFDLRFSIASGVMDTMEIGRYNFDQIPDILIYNRSNPNQKKYFLSYANHENSITYYEDKFMSSITHLTIDSTNYIITGLQIFGIDSVFYTFKGINMDTLIIQEQFHSIERLGDTKTFSYDRNKIVNIDPPYKSPIRFENGKEFADFNFDGFEDYRIASPIEGQQLYYCWDSTASKFAENETLSSMQSALFDWKNKIFLGDRYYFEDGVSVSDHYELRDGKIVVVARTKSFKTDDDQSEQRYHEIYQWQDGKLVLVGAGYVE